MEKKVTSSTIIGLILSGVIIVIGLVMYFLELYLESWAQYIGFIVLAGGIILAVINNARERENNVTFGNLFGFGFKVTAVTTVIMILYSVLSTYIFSDVKTKIIEMARNKALSNPNADPVAIDKGMEIFANNYVLFIVIGILFWYLIIGVLCSLLGAAIAKKNPVSPFQNS